MQGILVCKKVTSGRKEKCLGSVSSGTWWRRWSWDSLWRQRGRPIFRKRKTLVKTLETANRHDLRPGRSAAWLQYTRHKWQWWRGLSEGMQLATRLLTPSNGLSVSLHVFKKRFKLSLNQERDQKKVIENIFSVSHDFTLMPPLLHPFLVSFTTENFSLFAWCTHLPLTTQLIIWFFRFRKLKHFNPRKIAPTGHCCICQRLIFL